MRHVLSSRREASGSGGRKLYSRLGAAVVCSFVLASLLAASPTASEPASAAAARSDITVNWSNPDPAVKEFQPSRDLPGLFADGSRSDFRDLAITVSQTRDVIDQSVRVSVKGFTGTKSRFNVATNAQNFIQAMQCWGDPKDKDFRQTCQWGGRYSGNGVGNTLYKDNILRVAEQDIDPQTPTDVDNPFFRFSDAKKEEPVSGKKIIDSKGVQQYPILQVFGPTTTNEVSSARVGSDGTSFFDFETQSNNQAPHLGCGIAEHLRCWLVIVPRGSHYGGRGAECSNFVDPRTLLTYSYGAANASQVGSPINPGCDYWDNRLVVPLDFAPVAVRCPAGSAEVRLSGSQLMVGAMSSWQPDLCKNVKSTFSFSTTADSIARAGLIDSKGSSPQLIYTSFPVSSGELQSPDERELLAKATISYTPVGISAVSVAFIAEFANGREESLALSPRIMAKLLTQSYPFTVPANTSETVKNVAHLSATAKTYNYLAKDPDFRALNPNFAKFDQNNPSIVLPGPGGADAIRQVWRWITADKDAVDFLNGKPDPQGMTVNPYYLPRGTPASAASPGSTILSYLNDQKEYVDPPVPRDVGQTEPGSSTPQKLSESNLDYFPKDDESLVPLQLNAANGEVSRFDTIQFAPYSSDMLSGARQVFRGDTKSKTIWDAQKLNASNIPGDWVSSGIQLPGNKFMITITDSASAARYGLNSAALTTPNSGVTVKLDTDSMSAAMSALAPTSLDGVKQIDPAKVSAPGYPLTVVTYAGVNLTKTTPGSRTVFAAMLTQVTTAGQASGSGIGELPAGYLPLTSSLSESSASSIRAITTYTAPTPAKAPSAPSAGGAYATDDFPGGAGANGQSADTNSDPSVTAGADPQSDARTASSSTGALPSSALVIALIIGLAGALFAPVLFRGRGTS